MWRFGVMQYPRVVLYGRKCVVLLDRGGHIIYFVQTGPECWLASAPPCCCSASTRRLLK